MIRFLLFHLLKTIEKILYGKNGTESLLKIKRSEFVNFLLSEKLYFGYFVEMQHDDEYVNSDKLNYYQVS